jgi:small-conductance mechanosensitive channel
MAQWFLIFACSASGALVLAPIAATSMVMDSRRWWRIVYGAALFSAGINFVLGRSMQFAPRSNTLDRDVVALVVVGVACALVAAITARSLRGRSRLVRVLGVSAVAIVFIFVGPLSLIVAHCTSGDCL